MQLGNIRLMKEISLESSEFISGGGFCNMLAVAGGVIAVGSAAAAFKIIAVTAAFNPAMGVIGLGLAAGGLYCAAST
ncbi:MAG: hypothetical protein C0433_07185 [Cyclobacterium sp.]|nr:hypothetical protein [Cyclobacterium sp.]